MPASDAAGGEHAQVEVLRSSVSTLPCRPRRTATCGESGMTAAGRYRLGTRSARHPLSPPATPAPSAAARSMHSRRNGS
eukprot:scaffold24636_cov31-Tisochrysis_lutea.AAC.10